MSNKNVVHVLALFIVPAIGLVLGLVLAKMMDDGWLSSSWQTVAQPSVHVRSLEALNKDSLWVRSDSGDIYYNENASDCATDCWRKVDEIPKLPIPDDAISVINKPCAALPPLWGMTVSISECRKRMWQDYNSTFALLNDGTIRVWQVNVNGEGSFMLFMIVPVFGAIALFVLTLIFVLFSVFFDWLTRSKQADTVR